jgi:hypothetical protein
MLRMVVWALVAITVVARPAFAGGSVWDFDREVYRPGDLATAITAIAGGPDLGTPADGPFFAYLLAVEAHSEGAPYPVIPPGAVRVAEIQVVTGPYEEAPGVLVGPHHARFTFRVPDLPAGEYEVLHCNDPCTTTLADITWGRMRIAAPLASPPASPPIEGIEVDRTASAMAQWPLGSGALVASGLAAILVARRRAHGASVRHEDLRQRADR